MQNMFARKTSAIHTSTTALYCIIRVIWLVLHSKSMFSITLSCHYVCLISAYPCHYFNNLQLMNLLQIVLHNIKVSWSEYSSSKDLNILKICDWHRCSL